MAKTNYSKVEELLAQSQERLKIQGWLDMTKEESSPEELNPKAYLVASLRFGLDLLPAGDKAFYSDLGLRRAEILKLIRKPESLEEKDWGLVKEIQEKLRLYLEGIAEQLPQLSNEELIESERVKHITRRFDTRDRWLPLH